MSMNLYCNKIELWQTPTYISYMCMVSSSGLILSVVKNKRAKQALYCYIHWVKSTLNGVWEDPEVLQINTDNVNDHIKDILNIINKPDLKVEIK